MLCEPDDADRNWFHRLFSHHSPSYSYRLHPRDDAGARALGELRDRGLARTATAVARAAEHVESFFNVLRWELAFYMGCLNLYERLRQLGEPVAFPQPAPADAVQFSATGLYDVTLALTVDRRVVGNDVSASGKPLVLITGPNQGGKTTFLRSVGLAQLMMQSGMFVPGGRPDGPMELAAGPESPVAGGSLYSACFPEGNRSPGDNRPHPPAPAGGPPILLAGKRCRPKRPARLKGATSGGRYRPRRVLPGAPRRCE